MDALEQRLVAPLSGHPLLLAMMLSMFQQGGETLGPDRTSLYERAVERLATENNAERGERAPPRTMPSDRIVIAKALAVHAVLGGNNTIAVPDSDTVSDRTLNAACSHATRSDIFETLDTGLFTQHSQTGFSFAHRSLAEYLAADDLAARLESGLPLARVFPLFPVEYGV